MSKTSCEDLKEISNCIIDMDTLIALDKRAVEDLKNNTHEIGQEEVLTLIREFIRQKNDYNYIKKRYIPRYLVKAISNDLEQILSKFKED